MTRWLLLLAMLSLVLGCGSTPPKKSTAKKDKDKKPAAQQAPKEPEVTQDAFASYEAAMQAVVKGVADNKPTDISKAERWMGLQGAAIQGKLVETVKNPSANIAERISACRVYGRMGNVAAPLMLELSKPETKPDQLRLKAVECLGMPEHPEPAALNRLCDLVSDKDQRIRIAALRALRSVGKDAKKQRPEIVKQLQELLNSPTDDDAVRVAAKDALKEIEPRVGFSGMGKADK